MALPQIVIDTNVLVSAIRSKRGASYLLLTYFDAGKFEINVSVPLVLEYEAVLKGIRRNVGLTEADVGVLIDYICSIANRHLIDFLWRPQLPDPKDDMVLEIAIQAGCEAIVTHNVADFRGCDQFGVQIETPKSFLKRIGVIR
jgi:putative PIN family toxin of toxin-antitoxin system